MGEFCAVFLWETWYVARLNINKFHTSKCCEANIVIDILFVKLEHVNRCCLSRGSVHMCVCVCVCVGGGGGGVFLRTTYEAKI